VVRIERATAQDAKAISAMLGEIESYYSGKDVPGDVDQIRAVLFGEHPVATVLLARERDEVLGLASFSFLWPAAGADASLFLKELSVRAPYRRRGVARALMTAVRAEATAAGCPRVEWTADRDNPPALELYSALGFEEQAGKAFYRWQQ
jgi:ribosomal protein S18 acetylase RimI-like enzyme